MADKWVGVFTLAVLIGFVSYIESSSLLSRELVVNAPAMLAQAPAATPTSFKVSAEANKLCPKPKSNEAYSRDKPKFPATYKQAPWGWGPVQTITNLYGKSCSERNEKLGIYIQSECWGPENCHALKYEDRNGEMKDVKEFKLTTAGISSGGQSSYIIPPDSESTSNQGTTPPQSSSCSGCAWAAEPKSTPEYQEWLAKQNAPSPGAAPNSGNPLAQPQTPATPPATTGGNNSPTTPIQQIQNYQGPGTGSTQPTSGAAPQYSSGGTPTGQTTPTSYFDTSNPALHQPTGYNPTSPTGQPSGGYPTYNPLTQSYSPSNAPWQYSAPSYQSGGQKQSGNKIFSAVTSFISGFLSVQSQPVGTPYQSPPVSSPQVKYNVYVPGTVQPGPGSVTYIIVNNPASQQQPNYAPTNPTAPSQPDINEINRRIIALGTQGRRSPQDFVETDRPGPNSPPPSTYSVTTVGLESAFSEPKSLRPTPGPLAPEDAQSTSSAKWKGTRVVVTGIPIDITALIASYIGGWLPKTNTSFQAQAALAQAQSDYESTVAQIAALQEAQGSGLCDETCEISLTSLQSEVPIRQTNITTLRDTVRKKEGAQLELPAPATQISRVVENFVRSQNPGIGAPAIALGAEILNSISVPRGADIVSTPTRLPSPASVPASAQSPRGPAPDVSVASQEENTSAQGEVKSESAIVNVISRVWNALKSWFSPSATTPAPQKYCSLFSRIFGGCK